MGDSRHKPVLEVVADLAGVAHFRVDSERRITGWSAAAEHLTGFSKDEVLGMPCVVGVRCGACLTGCGVQDHGQVRHVPLILHRKDGTPLAIHKSGQALYDSEGKFDGAIEILSADTGSADTANESVDPLLDALGRFGLIADGDFNILRVTESLAQRVGQTPEQLVGTPLKQWLGDTLFGPEAPFRAAINQGERREGWLAQLLGHDGQAHAISLSAGPVASIPGNPARVFVMLRPAEEEAEAGEIPRFEGMVGQSVAMQRIFRLIDLLHDNDATVLISGQSGTGKELVARALHTRSHRAKGPFVAVNCGALPGDLLESELFGHVRGAFTGAVRDRPGRFELADGGTLFLDEVGDLPLNLQVKLLRVLQEQTFERVGDSTTRTADARIVAATNLDLAKAVADRQFREDLFYRLRVVPIDLPNLKARREDLEPLIRHLLRKIGRRRSRSLWLSPSAMRCLLAHDWPGNVRELENALEYATAVCEGQTVHIDDLPPEVRAPTQTSVAEAPAATAPLEAVPSPTLASVPNSREPSTPEAARIQAALEASQYRKQEAAERLGISRTTLWRRMRALGIS